MYNCIYSGHCSQHICDKSCPTLVETSYLLERNNININNNVFNRKQSEIDACLHILDYAEGKLATVIDVSTMSVADMITYCGICTNWKGSRLHCTVYNLKYSQYVEAIRNSWSSKSDSDDLEYMKIWSNSAKILIISNLDYVKFRDFECQTLLTLVQSRIGNGLTTIVVSPPISSLVGDSLFFGKLCDVLKQSVVDTDMKKAVKV